MERVRITQIIRIRPLGKMHVWRSVHTDSCDFYLDQNRRPASWWTTEMVCKARIRCAHIFHARLKISSAFKKPPKQNKQKKKKKKHSGINYSFWWLLQPPLFPLWICQLMLHGVALLSMLSSICWHCPRVPTHRLLSLLVFLYFFVLVFL